MYCADARYRPLNKQQANSTRTLDRKFQVPRNLCLRPDSKPVNAIPVDSHSGAVSADGPNGATTINFGPDEKCQNTDPVRRQFAG